MRNWWRPFLILGSLALFLGFGFTWYKAEVKSKDWKLVWSDEFDYTGLPDSSRWSYDKGDGCPNVCGWGNNELQYYTWDRAENARVEDGNLIIEAHKESIGNKAYSSARLVSRFKGDWTFGHFEVRAKLPSGVGTWPAIWMLPTDWKYGGWPKSGEIDIMEHVGYARDTVYGTVHTEAFNHMYGTHKGDHMYKPDAEAAFHNYAVDWNEDRIQFFVDDEEYFVFKNNGAGPAAWPFDKRFHFVMNLAVGGNWGGKHGVDENIWPQRMEIDYVRVYQKGGAAVQSKPD